MRLLIDMNLSPEWVEALAKHRVEATHWQELGDPKAADTEILGWARDNGRIVFTNDLDFGHLLASTSSRRVRVLPIK
jgi:predicted nuclease of predicted toxin-antitoxin system